MIIRKCNICGKVLDLPDDFYEVSEVCFRKGKPSQPYVRVEIGDNKNHDCSESWSDYCDLHFCTPCFLDKMHVLNDLLKDVSGQ